MPSIHWHNGEVSPVRPGTAWLEAARQARVSIPTGCLGGSCGACEIDVNGCTVRACVESVPATDGSDLWVEIAVDPFW